MFWVKGVRVSADCLVPTEVLAELVERVLVYNIPLVSQALPFLSLYFSRVTPALVVFFVLPDPLVVLYDCATTYPKPYST